MLEAHGITVTPREMSMIQRDFTGYPVAMNLLYRKLENGTPYSETVYVAAKRERFVCYEDAVSRRFDLQLPKLLVCIAPFESFELELAKMVSGDPPIGVGHYREREHYYFALP